MAYVRAAAGVALALAAAVALLLAAAGRAPAPVAAEGGGEVTLTLLHNNDGESALLPLTNAVGVGGVTVEVPVAGIAAFKSVIAREIDQARAAGNAVLAVYAGDAYLASAAYLCGQREGAPFFDAVAQDAIPYDAHIIGNHEFDSTPDVLERFIRSLGDQPFLSANLDFSREPGFADLVDDDGLIEAPVVGGRPLGRSMIVDDPATGARFGLVGATTPGLSRVSIPCDVTVTPDLPRTAAAVQAEIDRLLARGVNKIILVSHLQDLASDVAVIALLRGVDIAVSGGGNDLLQSPSVDPSLQLLPGEGAPVAGEYPLETAGADDRTVYIVTTAGNYKYAGRLDAVFNASGEIERIATATSYPRPVVPESEAAAAAGFAGAVAPDPALVAAIEEPVTACLAGFAGTTVATTEVLLDVSRAGLRGGESNAGNLIADAFLHAYDGAAATLGLPERGPGNPVIAVQNSGGIRQNAGDTLPTAGSVPGDIVLVNTLDVLPFPNAVSVIPSVSPSDLKTVFEVSGARYPATSGAFLQVAGIAVVYDPSLPAGSRVVSLTLASGDPVVAGGEIVEGAPAVTIVTSSFVANGGDGYEVLGASPNQRQILATYEQALREYLQALGTVSAGDPRYAPGGEGRSIFVEGPGGVLAAPDAGTGLASAERSSPALLVLLVLVGTAAAALVARRRPPPPPLERDR